MKRFTFFSSLLLCLLLFTEHAGQASAAPLQTRQWTRVRSSHFLLIGDADERDLRQTAIQLEQFRSASGLLFPHTRLRSSLPVRVVVFRNRQAFHPFLPVWQGKTRELGGYFQPGQDVHYIALTAEFRNDNPYATIFHEYAHAIINDNVGDNIGRVPLWLNEGLAEFYSTFAAPAEATFAAEKRLLLGKPLREHTRLLRENRLLPLEELFAVSHNSPHYNERDKRGLFYAQSWALVHYLMLGSNSQRQGQLVEFLQRLSTGASTEECFRLAFQTDLATLEKELKQYISRNAYTAQSYSLPESSATDQTLQGAPLSEAEWQAYLGDLLLHQQRREGEIHLKRALELNASLPLANAAMGQFHFHAGRFAEAAQHLQKAVASAETDSAETYLTHYFYAASLVRQTETSDAIHQRAPETLTIIRRELQQAITLNPAFAEAYNLLAFVNLTAGEQSDESIALINKAIALAPARQDFIYTLAQLQYRQRRFDEAERLLAPLAKAEADPQVRPQAQALLETINAYRRYQAERLRQLQEAAPLQNSLPAEKNTASAYQPGQVISGSNRPWLHRRNNDPAVEGNAVQGTLIRVECEGTAVILIIRTEEKTLRLHAASMERVQIASAHSEVSAGIHCGSMHQPLAVVARYKPQTEMKRQTDGELLAVSFLKSE